MAIESYVNEVVLDLACNDPVKVVKAKQLDNLTRTLSISFVDDGTTYQIPSGTTAEFRVQRPDRVLVSADNLTVGSSYVNVYLTDAMLEVAGRCIADVRLKNGSQVLSARAFFIDVYQTAQGKNFVGYIGDPACVSIVTEEQFDNMEKSDSTMYLVKDQSGTVTQYLGNTPILVGGLSFVKCTQQQYDDMSTHDENTVYIIVG